MSRPADPSLSPDLLDGEFARLIVESASDFAIIAMAPDATVLSWNPGAEKLLGWPAAEALGMDGRAIFTPEDREAGVPSAGAAAAWVVRSLVAWPADAWMLRRASGLDIKAQIRGLPSIALMAGSMAEAVVALGAALPPALPGQLRLAVLVAFGAAVHAALLAPARRGVARRLVSMVGSVAPCGR